MTSIERSIDIGVPASICYRAWTQLELFPHFMDGIESVEERDERHQHWRARIWGVTEEWDAEITEQIPDKRIAWRSEGGLWNAGVVTFHHLSDDRTRVMVQLEYRLEPLRERIGDALGILSWRIGGDLRRFKMFVEQQGDRICSRRSAVRRVKESERSEERTGAAASSA